MNEDETQNFRRQALAEWISQYGGARQVCLRMGCGKSVESYISQVLRGYSFGPRAARNLERKLGIPHNLLDSIVDLNKEAFGVKGDVPDIGVNTASSLAVTGSSVDVIHIHHFRMARKIKTRANGGRSKAYDRLQMNDQPGEVIDMCVTLEWLNKNVSSYTKISHLCLVTGFGDAMRPLFNPGDPVLLDIGVNSFTQDAVYLFRVESEAFLRRLQHIPGEGLRVLSSNPCYVSWTIKPEMNFEILGKVVKTWCGTLG